MLFDIYILSISPILACADRVGTVGSCYGIQNEEKVHRIMRLREVS